MLNRLALAAFLLILAGCSTFKPATDEDRAEIETVEEHDLTQNEAFDRLVRWVADTYPASSEVVQLSDRDAGAIVLQGFASLPAGAGVRYSMSMDVRDNRVRFRQQIGRFIGTGSDYLSTSEAVRVRDQFAALRASAMLALAEDDDF